MMKNKHGAVLILIFMLIGLFITSLLFLMFVIPVQTLTDIANNNSAVLANEEAQKVVSRISNIWYIIPLIVIILVVVWAFARAMQREPLSGY